ncbi:MAG TPA: hypothetical protein PL009_10120 [Flavipsychrobacter sp.]|nr:hypothetical protein [Flavipsychrobacter sp.]
MKKILFSVLALSSVLGFQSCSEDFEVSAPYKPVTVVYGILDMKDTAHYIRIQKTFLDESKNAFDMAKVSDSNFYKEGDLDVMIKEMSGNAVVGQPMLLQRVNMENEGYVKDSGVFFRTPNYAYKFKKLLKSSLTYRLVINNRATNTVDSADIQLVDTATLTVLGATQNKRINFASTDPTKSGSTFSFYVNAGNAYYLEAAIRFHWVEKVPNSADPGVRDSASFVFTRLSSIDDIKEGRLEVDNSKIIAFLQSAMGAAPQGIARYMDSCEIVVYGAGKEYSDYINTLQIQSSGLTADQIKPLYTNIRGKDVFGLFSSKTTRVLRNAYIDDETLNMLNGSENTRSLNIQKQRADP